MSNPIFSVIVCVYNGEKYLTQCLDSVINQTFQNIEVIIIDDGSTDKTAEIADNYTKKDKRISVIHQNNQGQSQSKNVGINNSKGEYLVFVDSDDWLSKHYFESVYTYLIYQPDLLLMSYISEPSGSVVSTHYKAKNLMLTGLDLVNSNPVIHTSNDACFSWRFVFNRVFILNNKLFFNPNITIGEDTELNLRALKAASKAICIDYAGYHYRTDNVDSLMRQKYSKTLEKDLQLQFPTRYSVSSSKQYQKDMARYYVEILLHRVISNVKKSPNGLRRKDIRRISQYEWLKTSFQIIGKNLKELSGNQNAYIMNLLIKHRFCLIYYILIK